MKLNITLAIRFFTFSGLLLSEATSAETYIENSTVIYTTNKLDTLEAYSLNEVAVSGKGRKNLTTAKAGIKEMDLPQAVIVLDKKLIENQQINSVADLLKNTNGMYIMGTTGGYQEEIASRGTNITTTNTFKNGIRYYGGMKTVLSGIETAEILKGSAALLYGNVAPGGVLNLITKKPRTEFGGSVGLTYGSFNQINPTFDVYGSLNNTQTIHFRLDGSYDQANSYRKEVKSKTYYINPSLLFNIGAKTSLLVEGDYTRDVRTPDFGAGIVNYQLVALPRNRFLGVSWGEYKSAQTFLSAKATHKFNKNIQLSALTGLRYYNTDLFSNSRPNTSGNVVAVNGDWIRSIQRSSVDDHYFIQQIDLNCAFDTWTLPHKLLIGMDLESYTTKTTSYNTYTKYDKINIFNEYDASNELAAPVMTKNTLTTAPVKRYGLYVQDLITLNKYLKMLLGTRYSRINSESEVYTFSKNSTMSSSADDFAYSPKAGIVFQPSATQSLFASYSNSFALNTGVDVNGATLDPSIFDQYEIGVKQRLLDEKMSVNLTVYQIDNSNMAQTSWANGNTNSNSNIKELSGATRGRGLELDLEYRPCTNLAVMGGYSYTKTIYTASNTYVVGSELRYNPKNTANASLHYSFNNGLLKNFQAGFLCSYVGDRYVGRSTRVTVENDTYRLIPLDGFFQHDVVLGYSLKKWTMKAKISNITNVMNYYAHDDNSLNPIAPLSTMLTVKYNF